MSKNTYYFSHDYNVRSDQKIKKLISKHGYLGYGIFWAIIEDLYNNANALPLDFDCIAFDLRCDPDLVNSVVSDFDLFVFEGSTFGSLSVRKRLEEREAKSKKARDSANKRWPNKGLDANALRSHSDSNAIKERKGKEIKGKEIKGKEIKDNIDIRKLKFSSTLSPFINIYGKDFLNDFYKYWTEPNKSNTRFRQELEKTWDLERRLMTWSKNEKNFNKQTNGKSNTISKTESYRQTAANILAKRGINIEDYIKQPDGH